MEPHEAYVKLANYIFKTGEWEDEDSPGSLVPTGTLRDEVTPYNIICDAIDLDCQATHYTLNWLIPGIMVRVKLYKADVYGATEVKASMRVKTVNVDVIKQKVEN